MFFKGEGKKICDGEKTAMNVAGKTEHLHAEN
jgi:hypothetical protein